MLVQAKLLSLLNKVLNQQAKLRKGGSQALYYCFACHHYKRKLEINLETGQWHCWTCDIKGSYLGSFLTKIKASRKYRDELHKLTGDIRLLRRKNKKADVELVLPDEFHPLAIPLDTPEYKNALYYLKKRKLIPEDIVRYNIGYCESGEYEGHIIIPSYDADGHLNFFIGRRYYDIEKTVSHKKPEVPMNIIGFESFVNWSQPVNLCEGAFDAIAIRTNAIPLFGKYLQPKLLSAFILNKVKRINLILDNDALNDAIKNYQKLQRWIPADIHVVKLDGKDPSKLGFEKVWDLIHKSAPFKFTDLMAYKLGL